MPVKHIILFIFDKKKHMNKLISTDSGGYPFVLDDLRFQDEAYRDAIKGVCRSFARPTLTNDGFIFDDLDTGSITIDSSWTFPATYCYLNGEIYLIPETILNSTPTATKYYVLEENFSFTGTAPGLKTFQDGNSHETYQIRKAKLTLKTSLSSTDVLILTGNSVLSCWTYETSNMYSVRHNALTGVLGLKDDVETIKNTLDEQSLNDGTWAQITDKTTIPTSLFYNSNVVPLLTGNISVSSGIVDYTNSHLKAKIIGKTLLCDFQIKSLVLPTYSTTQVGSIILRLNQIPGITISEILKFSAVGRADCNHAGALVGALSIENHDLINDAILLTIDAPHHTSKKAFNLEYEFISSTSTIVDRTATETHVMTWTLKGSFHAQLL